MKKITKLLCFLLMITCLFTVTSCQELLDQIASMNGGSTEVTDGESKITVTNTIPSKMDTTDKTIDWTKYFKIVDSLKGSIEVLDEYIDASGVNPKVPGTYILKFKYKTISKSFTITFSGKDYSQTTQEDVKLGNATISQVTKDGLIVSISYTKVSSCTSYQIKIYNSDNALVTTLTGNGTAVSYTFTEAGTYSVSVKAVATATGFTDGDESTKYAFTVEKKSTTYTPERETTFASRIQPKMLADSNYYGVGIPSIGTPRVLVVPVDFSNTTYTTTQINTIKKGFTGTESDTGYESLHSYYYKSSYGQLDIQVDFAPTYKLSKKASTFERNFNSWDESYILDEIMEAYDSTIDFSKYDYNKDGDIDGIYMIYNYEVDYNSGDVFWAWCTWRKPMGDNVAYDNVYPNYYNWTSYYFFEENVAVNNTTKDINGDAAVSGLKINALTIIHESGHMLCLDDYYDYTEDKGVAGGLGGYDMMDYNQGDHCAYSKIMLGWVNPYIVTDTCTITLNKFSTTGDAILIPKDKTNPYFGEFITIEYFVPDGVNRLFTDYVFSINGVKIMQVDNTLVSSFDSENQFSFTKYDNSESAHKLIRYIEANMSNNKFNIERSTSSNPKYASNDTLFETNDTFNPGVTGSRFSSLKWYSGTAMNFSVTVVSMNSNSCTISITFK